jgi:serine/threonine protein kinase
MQELCVPTEAGPEASTKGEAPDPATLAAAFPHLEIGPLVGRGGMGFVFKARQPKLDRHVALKILPRAMAANPTFAERFAREGRLLARLNHPNIVAVYDFGQAGDFFYLLMEYVDGVNLRQALRLGRFTPAQALSIVPKICEALEFAHREGILHRDIKPENILLDSKGRIKIADFGIAKLLTEASTEQTLTGSGAALGTPHYMAPEQLERTSEVDERADIYSLGVVFYEMLTGELPIGKFQPPSEKAQVDVRLDEVVLHALEKEPTRRYQHVSQVKTAVDTIVATPGNAIPPRNPAEAPAYAPGSSDKFWKHFAVVFGVAVLGLLALGIWKWHPQQFTESKPAPVASTPTPTNPPPGKIAGTWSPGTTSGGTPDLQRILDTARDLVQEGSYEDALQRYLWYDENARKIDKSASLISVTIDWVELGRRYPKAKQALLAIRDAGVREFSEDRGYSELFQKVSYINSQYQDEEATYALFKKIRETDPALARQCYSYAQDLLIAHGDYEYCLSCLGDLEDRYATIERLFNMQMSFYGRYQGSTPASGTNHSGDLIPTRALRLPPGQSEPGNSANSLPVGPVRIDNLSTQMVKSAQSTFVRQVCQLVEILVGTDNRPQAAIFRDKALKVVDAPGLRSAIDDAEIRVKKNRQAGAVKTDQAQPPVSKDRKAELPNLKRPLPPASASVENWSPTLAQGEKPNPRNVSEEAKALMDKGDYEAALQRQLWYHNHALEYDPHLSGVRISFALAQWTELARRYPKAKTAMMEVRDSGARELMAGRGGFSLFQDVRAINSEWNNEPFTLELFKYLDVHQPDLAKQCYRVAEALLVEQKDYAICGRYVTNGQARFDSIKQTWETGKKWEEKTQEIQRKATLVSPATGLPLPPQPKHYDPIFVQETSRLIEILVATNRRAEAEKIRDQALGCVDHPDLRSAIESSEKRIARK